jgi:hypothetical protein
VAKNNIMDCFIENLIEVLKFLGAVALGVSWIFGGLILVGGMWSWFRDEYDDPRSITSKVLWRIGAVIAGVLYITISYSLHKC